MPEEPCARRSCPRRPRTLRPTALGAVLAAVLAVACDGPVPPNDPPVVCGGPDAIACAPGDYCHYDRDQLCGADDVTGRCEMRPEVCIEVHEPVCGCDGKTYGNACKAAAAGMSVAREGPCEGS